MNDRKDELAQVYRITQDENGVYHRHYIYSASQKTNGGLHVNYRSLASKEKTSPDIGFDLVSCQFKFNMNAKIVNECKIVYRGTVYDIKSVDDFDRRQRDMKVIAQETTDTYDFGEDEYDG